MADACSATVLDARGSPRLINSSRKSDTKKRRTKDLSEESSYIVSLWVQFGPQVMTFWCLLGPLGSLFGSILMPWPPLGPSLAPKGENYEKSDVPGGKSSLFWTQKWSQIWKDPVRCRNIKVWLIIVDDGKCTARQEQWRPWAFIQTSSGSNKS